MIALAALAIFGFIQAGLAKTNAIEAQSQAATAQAASTLAVSNAATAVANQAEAERQANIALARQLAAKAQSIYVTGDSKQEVAVLLAIQSMHLFPVLDGSQILQKNKLSSSVARMTHDSTITSVAVSPNGKYVVSGSWDSTARVWEAFTGNEVARMTHENEVFVVSFSPDGKYVVSGGDTTARVWSYLPKDLIEESCSRVTRNLTRPEWTQYLGSALSYQAVRTNLPAEPQVTTVSNELYDLTDHKDRQSWVNINHVPPAYI